MTTRVRRNAAGVALALVAGVLTVAAIAAAGEQPGEGGDERETPGASSRSDGEDRAGGGTDAGTEGQGTHGKRHGSAHGSGGSASARDAKRRRRQASAAEKRAGRRAFFDVARVLQSPRCMNCHPDGDRPLQTDESRPHQMNISRESLENGMECATCHRDRNSEAYGIDDGPPGAPHWGLPPADTPMIFENRTPGELCRQIRDPDQNGGKSLDALLEHVAEDPLVLWGWNPGGDRSKPPLSHEKFVDAFETWVDSGGACPTGKP